MSSCLVSNGSPILTSIARPRSDSLIQTDDVRTWYFVAGSAVFAIANYVRFAKSTIWQM